MAMSSDDELPRFSPIPFKRPVFPAHVQDAISDVVSRQQTWLDMRFYQPMTYTWTNHTARRGIGLSFIRLIPRTDVERLFDKYRDERRLASAHTVHIHGCLSSPDGCDPHAFSGLGKDGVPDHAWMDAMVPLLRRLPNLQALVLEDLSWAHVREDTRALLLALPVARLSLIGVDFHSTCHFLAVLEAFPRLSDLWVDRVTWGAVDHAEEVLAREAPLSLYWLWIRVRASASLDVLLDWLMGRRECLSVLNASMDWDELESETVVDLLRRIAPSLQSLYLGSYPEAGLGEGRLVYSPSFVLLVDRWREADQDSTDDHTGQSPLPGPELDELDGRLDRIRLDDAADSPFVSGYESTSDPGVEGDVEDEGSDEDEVTPPYYWSPSRTPKHPDDGLKKRSQYDSTISELRLDAQYTNTLVDVLEQDPILDTAVYGVKTVHARLTQPALALFQTRLLCQLVSPIATREFSVKLTWEIVKRWRQADWQQLDDLLAEVPPPTVEYASYVLLVEFRTFVLRADPGILSRVFTRQLRKTMTLNVFKLRPVCSDCDSDVE